MSASASTLPPVTARSLSLVGWLIASWIVMVVLGYVALRSEGAPSAGNAISVERSVFTSSNVASLTGFGVGFARPHEFAPMVRSIFALQTLVGALLALIGGGVLTSRMLGLPHSDSRIALTSLVMLAFGAVVGVATIGAGEATGQALMRGVGAMACSGLLFGNVPAFDSSALLLALIPMSIAGSLGPVFVLELKDWIRHKTPMNAHVRSALALAGAVYIGGTLIGWFLMHDPLRASALSLSARAYGLPVDLQLDSGWSRALTVWASVLVLIGPGTTGAAGGFGLGFLATFRKRFLRPVLLGVAIQMGLLIVGLMILLQIEPQLSAERVILIATSAAAGVGLSHDPLTITGPGLFVLSLLMLTSRLLPLMVLAAMLRNGLGGHDVVTQAVVDK